MIRAVIFDIDGVILDSERIHAETESETAAAFGINISPEEVIKQYSGIYIEVEFDQMAKNASKPMPIDQALKVKDKILKSKLERGVPLVPFVKEVLDILKSKYKLGFATNGDRFFVEDALSKAVILDYFKAQVYAAEVGASKPDPKIFLEVARKLQVNNTDEVVVIEDSESGFKGAKAAGMLLIARKAHHNENKDFSLADYIVEDLREIPKILESIS